MPAILYNVTINIDDEVHQEWLNWMRTIHIPDVMKTGSFLNFRLLKIIGDEESGGYTYAVQYTCESLEKFREYEKRFAPELRQAHSDKFKDKFASFRTLLEIIS